jgi:hypothetical protein
MIKNIELLLREDGEDWYLSPIQKDKLYVLKIELFCKMQDIFKVSISSSDFLIKGNNTKTASNKSMISFKVQPIKTKKKLLF